MRLLKLVGFAALVGVALCNDESRRAYQQSIISSYANESDIRTPMILPKCTMFGTYPVPGHRQYYYKCYKLHTDTYEQTIHKCEGDQIFNDVTSLCEAPAQKTNKNDFVYPRCRREGKFPVPEDITRMYLCTMDPNTGRLIQKNFVCPAGTVYCEKKKYCVLRKKEQTLETVVGDMNSKDRLRVLSLFKYFSDYLKNDGFSDSSVSLAKPAKPATNGFRPIPAINRGKSGSAFNRPNPIRAKPGSATNVAKPGSAVNGAKPANAANRPKPGVLPNGAKPYIFNGARPGSPTNGAKPGSAANVAKPGSMFNGAKTGLSTSGRKTQSGSTLNGAKPVSVTNGAKPGFAASGAKPGSMANGAKPGSMANGAKPGSTINGAKPGSMTNGAKPGSMTNGAKPGSMINGAKPGSMTNGAKPGLTINGAKPGYVVNGAKSGSAASVDPSCSATDGAQSDSIANAAELSSTNGAKPSSASSGAKTVANADEPGPASD